MTRELRPSAQVRHNAELEEGRLQGSKLARCNAPVLRYAGIVVLHCSMHRLDREWNLQRTGHQLTCCTIRITVRDDATASYGADSSSALELCRLCLVPSPTRPRPTVVRCALSLQLPSQARCFATQP